MRFLILSLLLFVSTFIYAGGPWLQPHKKGYVQTQFTLPIGYYNRIFLEDGSDLQLNNNVLDVHWQNYTEYGLLKKTNLLLDIPFKYVEANNYYFSKHLLGFSNVAIGIKQQLTNKNWLSSISFTWNFNTISKKLAYGLSTGYNDNLFLPNYSIGRGWAKTYFYTEIIGVKALKRYSDSWKINIELGKKIRNKHWLAITINSLQSFKNKSFNDNRLKQTALYPNNQEYLAYGVKFIYSLKDDKKGLTFATYGALAGNYVAHLATLNAGYFWKF